LQHDFIGAPATQGNSKITAHPALGQDEQPAQGAHGLGISLALRFLTYWSAVIIREIREREVPRRGRPRRGDTAHCGSSTLLPVVDARARLPAGAFIFTGDI